MVAAGLEHLANTLLLVNFFVFRSAAVPTSDVMDEEVSLLLEEAGTNDASSCRLALLHFHH